MDRRAAPARGCHGQHRLDCDVAGRPQLAGQALRRRRVDACQHVRASSCCGGGQCAAPSSTRTRQVVQRGPPAAGRLVRNAVAATGLEHGPATRHGNPSVRIGDSNHRLASPLVEAADKAQAGDEHDGGEVRIERVLAHVAEDPALRFRRPGDWGSAGARSAAVSSRPIVTKPRAASTGSSSAAPNSGRLMRCQPRRLPNAKRRPRQPCSQPGANKPRARPCPPAAQMFAATRA